MNNYYKVLGVTKDIDQKGIKYAYKKLALKYHPDKWKGKNDYAQYKFIKINTAYKVLSDNNRRFDYDNGIDITEKELRQSQNLARNLFNSKFFKNDYGKIVKKLSNEDKKIIWNFVSPFYDDQKKFYNDLKNGKTDEIMKNINSKIIIYMKNISLKTIVITITKYSWYIILYCCSNLKSFIKSFF